MLCNCGSLKNYEECCGKFISGEVVPKSAEELMKSRYTAYTTQNIDYIMNTHDRATLNEVSRDILEEWSTSSKWLSLQILNCEKGCESDKEGIVEFIAKYELHGAVHSHHEKSLFIKDNGKWYYSKALPIDMTIKKESKAGRNDPCPCGSGKKYKKCCG